MKWFGAARGWLQGKKTMLGGLVLIAAGVAGTAFGKLPVDQAAVVVGLGISIAGWAAKADRHQQQILEALSSAAALGVAVRSGDKQAESRIVSDAAKQAVVLIADQQSRQAGV